MQHCSYLRFFLTATTDPVAEYLERSSKSHIIVPFQKRAASQRQAAAACSRLDVSKESTLSDNTPNHRSATSPAGDHDCVLDEPAAKRHKPQHVEHGTDHAIRNQVIRDGAKEELKKKVTCGKYLPFLFNSL